MDFQGSAFEMRNVLKKFR